MKNAVRKEIRKQVKINGSHLATIKRAISIQFPSVNFDEFKDYTEEQIEKKYQAVQISVKASIRF